MRTLGEVIRERRRATGLTLKQLAEAIACTKSYLSMIENDRRTQPPPVKFLARLESALRVEAGELVALREWQQTPDAVKRHVADLRARNAAADHILSLLRENGIDDAHRSGRLRRAVEEVSADEPDTPAHAGTPPGSADRTAAHPEPPAETAPEGGGHGDGADPDLHIDRVLPAQIPLINSVAAGYSAEFTDLGYPARVADRYVALPDVYDADAFAARVTGDSMHPEYREGDIVVFSPAAETPPGSDCFVRYDRAHRLADESTFKRVYYEEDPEGGQMIRLQPLNSHYPPRVVPREAIAGLYAAVSVVRRIHPNSAPESAV